MFQDYQWLSPQFKRTKAIVNPMLKLLEKEGKNLKILDAGCGDGTVSELLVKLGYEIWGVDQNLDVLREAEKRGVRIIHSELGKKIPFDNESFDVIWCLRTLEHIYNTEEFLKGCHRLLKSNSILLLTAQNMVSLVNRFRTLFGFYPLWVAPSESYPSKEYPRFAEHVRCFTKSTLEEIVRRAGFKIEKTTSDFLCFNPGMYNRRPWSELLGKFFPSFGETLIIKARKE